MVSKPYKLYLLCSGHFNCTILDTVMKSKISELTSDLWVKKLLTTILLFPQVFSVIHFINRVQYDSLTHALVVTSKTITKTINKTLLVPVYFMKAAQFLCLIN